MTVDHVRALFADLLAEEGVVIPLDPEEATTPAPRECLTPTERDALHVALEALTTIAPPHTPEK
jgi:hypothetical protein